MSKEHSDYLNRIKRNKRIVIGCQFMIIILFIMLWELLSRFNIINSFIFSSPTKIIDTIISLIKSNSLFSNIIITFLETILSFILCFFTALLISSLFWYKRVLYRIFEPFLTLLNSLPKVALGPIIIIWFGANIKSIIIMALLISVFVTILNLYQSFIETDSLMIKLLKSMGASKWQIYTKLVIPYNYSNIINTLKIDISMCLIGVVMGEFLVSKSGIGYLIMYGSQVFNLNLVMSGYFLLQCII